MGATQGGTSKDTRYLEQHHGSWRVVVGYRVNGKVVKLRRSLGTGSLREAQRRRWAVVAELKSQPTVHNVVETLDPETIISRAEEMLGEPVATEADERGGPVYIFDPERERRATTYFAQATQTPLDRHLQSFLASRGELKADSRRRHEVAVRDVAHWLKAEGLPSTIEAVDRRVAIRYVDQLPPGHPDPQRLSLIWEWMVRREHAQTDPWRDLRAAPRARVEPERAWTDSEVKALLSGPCSPSLRLLMEVGALTGARLNAIINMRVDRAQGQGPNAGTIILPPQKQELGPRTIPLHSHLREALADFKGWPWANQRSGSGAVSDLFGDYRRKVLGPDPPGRRRAVANFHSFRRWFISQAERAGIDERIISDVVGHARRSMTGRYSAGATMEQMRVCVEAVKLPT